MQPSEKQQKIYDTWQNEDCNILVQAVAGSGKEQPLWCKVQTPFGPKEIGSLKINDIVFGLDGKEQFVTNIFPQGLKDYYKVTFRDNSFTYCGIEHLWTVNNAGKYNDKNKTMSLSEILIRGFSKTCGQAKFRVPLCNPVEYQETSIKIDAYLLGLLIGDGCMVKGTPCLSVNSNELEIINYCNKNKDIIFNFRTISENGVQSTLVPKNKKYSNSESWIKKEIDLLGLNQYSHNKFIPLSYLYNSVENRIKLLQGLMDSDGSCHKNRTTYSSTSLQLISNIKELVNSLGGIAIETKSTIKDDNHNICYNLNIKTTFCPFKFSYKKYNWKFSYKNGPSRYITNIEKIGSCEQVCIKVSNENQLYLTDNFIVTHNSTTLLELGKLSTHKSCLYLAFNKTIQLELEEKIKQNNMNHCSALTLHGLGLSMITKVKKAEVNDGKVYNLMYEIINKNKWLYKLKSDTRNELDFLRYALIDCNNISRLYLTSDLDEIEKYGFIMGKVFSYDILTQVEKDKLFQKYRRIFSSDEEVINSPDYNAEYQSINRRKFIVLWNKLYELREESYSGENIVIDFLDMIYLPVIKSVPVPTQYQYMFVDECQDLSYLQQKFIDKLILEGEIEKYSAFGDFRQSIYLFAGAFSKSFDMFRHRENVVELPLDINYRCSTNIIAYANEVYNNLLPFKTSEGVVKHIKEADYTKREDNLYRLEDIVRNIDDDCLIICRNTKPLIQLYFNLLSVNRTPSFVGNDILNSVVNFLKPYKKDTVKTFKEELHDELKLLVAKKDESDRSRLEYLLTKSNNETFTLIQNRLKYADNLLIDNVIGDLKEKLSRKGDIKLCTIHKSKGLEHNTVYLLNENLIPSKFALTEEALVQEQNIRYVARTRSKENLYLLNLKEEEKD